MMRHSPALIRYHLMAGYVRSRKQALDYRIDQGAVEQASLDALTGPRSARQEAGFAAALGHQRVVVPQAHAR